MNPGNGAVELRDILRAAGVFLKGGIGYERYGLDQLALTIRSVIQIDEAITVIIDGVVTNFEAGVLCPNGTGAEKGQQKSKSKQSHRQLVMMQIDVDLEV